MMLHTALKHNFVESFPECLQPGVLYISMEYASASHLCCCGCGEEVVTPFAPTEWKMAFDGESVSLWPSIGNWNLPCRSHYIIRDGRAIEASPWSDHQVSCEKDRDRRVKDEYFNRRLQELPISPIEEAAELPVKRNWLRSAIRWIQDRLGS
jgi:hypothetical protein